MQPPLQPQPGSQHTLSSNLEKVSLVGSIGLAVASAITQQVVLASAATVALSVTATFNLVNRKRLIDDLGQASVQLVHQQDERQQAAIATLIQRLEEQQQRLDPLVNQAPETQQALATLSEQSQSHQAEITTLNQQQVEDKQQLAEQITQVETTLTQQTQELQQTAQKLAEKEERVASIVQQLREIDQITQLIRFDPRDAALYYRRGVIRQALDRIEDQRIAIDDFTQAIDLQANHAEAFFNRGVLHSELGEKQQALKDLRAAAKLYFEQGDLSNYDRAITLSQQQHDLPVSAPATLEEDTEPAIEGLFA
jgi:tetratricopeptide (TPR) repeat protein